MFGIYPRLVSAPLNELSILSQDLNRRQHSAMILMQDLQSRREDLETLLLELFFNGAELQHLPVFFQGVPLFVTTDELFSTKTAVYPVVDPADNQHVTSSEFAHRMYNTCLEAPELFDEGYIVLEIDCIEAEMDQLYEYMKHLDHEELILTKRIKAIVDTQLRDQDMIFNGETMQVVHEPKKPKEYVFCKEGSPKVTLASIVASKSAKEAGLKMRVSPSGPSVVSTYHSDTGSVEVVPLNNGFLRLTIMFRNKKELVGFAPANKLKTIIKCVEIGNFTVLVRFASKLTMKDGVLVKSDKEHIRRMHNACVDCL